MSTQITLQRRAGSGCLRHLRLVTAEYSRRPLGGGPTPAVPDHAMAWWREADAGWLLACRCRPGAGDYGQNGHKRNRPHPKRPQTETATNRNTIPHGKSSMKGWCGQTAPGAGWPQTGGSGLYLQNSIFSAIPLIINEQYEPRKAVLYYFVLTYLCAHRTWGIW